MIFTATSSEGDSEHLAREVDDEEAPSFLLPDAFLQLV